jgi:hypothetical protein
MQLLQLPLSDPRHLLQPAAELAGAQRLGFRVLERPKSTEFQAITPCVIRQAAYPHREWVRPEGVTHVRGPA